MYTGSPIYQHRSYSQSSHFFSNLIEEHEKNYPHYHTKNYRYAFNGMEQDKEVSGNGNSYTTQFRQYDPRLGRWKSLDPLTAKYASMSPYIGMGNNPMFYTDPLGLEPNGRGGKGGRKKKNRAGKLNGKFDKNVDKKSGGKKRIFDLGFDGTWTINIGRLHISFNHKISRLDLAKGKFGWRWQGTHIKSKPDKLPRQKKGKTQTKLILKIERIEWQIREQKSKTFVYFDYHYDKLKVPNGRPPLFQTYPTFNVGIDFTDDRLPITLGPNKNQGMSLNTFTSQPTIENVTYGTLWIGGLTSPSEYHSNGPRGTHIYTHNIAGGGVFTNINGASTGSNNGGLTPSITITTSGEIRPAPNGHSTYATGGPRGSIRIYYDEIKNKKRITGVRFERVIK